MRVTWRFHRGFDAQLFRGDESEGGCGERRYCGGVGARMNTVAQVDARRYVWGEDDDAEDARLASAWTSTMGAKGLRGFETRQRLSSSEVDLWERSS